MVAHANACLKCGIYVFVYAAERVIEALKIDGGHGDGLPYPN